MNATYWEEIVASLSHLWTLWAAVTTGLAGHVHWHNSGINVEVTTFHTEGPLQKMAPTRGTIIGVKNLLLDRSQAPKKHLLALFC